MTAAEAMTTGSTTNSTAGPTRFRPGAGIVRGLAWRAALVDLAAIAVVLGLPAWARTPLSLAAAAVVVVFFLRRSRRRGLVDGILTAVGVAVVVLMLIGVGLNLLPGGITGTGWGVAVGLVELAFLLALAYWRPPVAVTRSLAFRRPPVGAIVWTVLIAGVLTTALVWSISSFSSTHVAPLALGAVTSKQSAVVTVSSGSDAGPYELRSVSDSGVSTTLFEDITVGPGKAASFTIVTPSNTRATLELVKAGGSSPVRQLIIDTRSSTLKVSG
jgi:hypothetical protein